MRAYTITVVPSVIALAVLLSLGACSKQRCPAYGSTKEANRISSPITASVASPAPRQ